MSERSASPEGAVAAGVGHVGSDWLSSHHCDGFVGFWESVMVILSSVKGVGLPVAFRYGLELAFLSAFVGVVPLLATVVTCNTCRVLVPATLVVSGRVEVHWSAVMSVGGPILPSLVA